MDSHSFGTLSRLNNSEALQGMVARLPKVYSDKSFTNYKDTYTRGAAAFAAGVEGAASSVATHGKTGA